MIAFILLSFLCVNCMQILALPSPQLVYPDPNFCALCSHPVSVVPVIDSNIDYVDSINYPIAIDVGLQPVPHVWPSQGILGALAPPPPQIGIIPNYYIDNTLYDPVEDVVRSALSQLVEMCVNAEDFVQRKYDFLNRLVDPYIV